MRFLPEFPPLFLEKNPKLKLTLQLISVQVCQKFTVIIAHFEEGGELLLMSNRPQDTLFPEKDWIELEERLHDQHHQSFQATFSSCPLYYNDHRSLNPTVFHPWLPTLLSQWIHYTECFIPSYVYLEKTSTSPIPLSPEKMSIRYKSPYQDTVLEHLSQICPIFKTDKVKEQQMLQEIERRRKWVREDS